LQAKKSFAVPVVYQTLDWRPFLDAASRLSAISVCWVSTIPQQGDEFYRSGSPHRNPNGKEVAAGINLFRSRLPNGFTPAWRTLEWSRLVGATDHTMCIEGGILDG
jgi:hypothetical protein